MVIIWLNSVEFEASRTLSKIDDTSGVVAGVDEDCVL